MKNKLFAVGTMIVVVVILLFSGFAEMSSAMPYPPPGNMTVVSGLPTPFETPICVGCPVLPGSPQSYLPLMLYEYPWAYGSVDGTLINEYDETPVDGVCLKLAKVWCDDDNGMPGGCYFVYAEEWSPAAFTEPDTGHFLVDTHVSYATKANGVRPHDGGTGWFVPIAFEYCSIYYGAYDIIEDGAPEGYTARVIRVWPDQTTYVGELKTWFQEPIGIYDDSISIESLCKWNSVTRELACPLGKEIIQ